MVLRKYFSGDLGEILHCCDFPVVRKLKVDKDLVDREPWRGSGEYLRVDINIFDSVGTPDLGLVQ